MPALKTMFQLTGRGYAAANLSNASLLIIDAQNEYLSGPLALSGMDAATANIARLLEAARKARRPVIHIRHLGTVGGMFDPQGERGAFIKGLEPQGDELIIEKRMPNAFNDTGLQKALENLGSLDVIVCGFMSHSSVSTTVRGPRTTACAAPWCQTPAPLATCRLQMASSAPSKCKKPKWPS